MLTLCALPHNLQNAHATWASPSKAFSPLQPAALRVQKPLLLCKSLKDEGKDVLGGAVESWLDVANFVSGGGGNKTPYADLAYKLGSDVYADISGWHLYLRDLNAAPGIKMADALAHELGQLVSDQGYNEAAITSVVSKVPVSLGKGKVKVALLDLLPATTMKDLLRIMEDFARRR